MSSPIIIKRHKKIIINGANGKMGQIVCSAIKNNPNFILSAKLTKTDNLEKTIKKTNAKIVIDFTNSNSVYKNTLTIINNNAHPIIGTSGLTNEQIKKLKTICKKKKLGGLIVPNFSISSILMQYITRKITNWFKEIEIIEMHHKNKKDIPSYTAIKTAEIIKNSFLTKNKKNLTFNYKISNKCNKKINPIKRIPIHSLRMSGILSCQQIIFSNIGETLTISQNNINRKSFLPGIILSCQKVSKLKSLHLGLEKILIKNKY
ncbi:4-hydroxy-tetrahydrodipicolinate reductase [Candidatus Legionella polyplacis]|uniref:4-hydroxy-tetrahydrodipicolinate reductase n=1 Tax=Candidatus Legionella polyplacis TaxID=2005262 RepID=A0ABZ2GVL5_9GAMM|nr:4-hydroxy-tetrahydrodipicolinate reductase [Candidatus Legionella polyplacis]ATW02029.1 4-hydroxy-tetrahydrodipicolinate reductase [Candidatus Legionella polyplacis]